METLEHKSFMPPEHLIMVDAILSMPGATIEAEYQRRINAINAMAAFCRMEEGQPTLRPTPSRRRPVPDGDDPCPPAKRQRRSVENDTEILLRQATEAMRIKSQNDQPQICFLCIRNFNLLLKGQIAEYTTSGSLTRHFLQKHVNPLWPVKGVECNRLPMEQLYKEVLLLKDCCSTAHLFLDGISDH
ncbi:hypothetical protein CISG_06113 [Coccidioides immitis RMSCC 3703]|uniref:Uncharacterized protein n=1 Tax=Coccidioides immitis RMSCC 3703 TaxID=454286 RepID=A0A0J8QYI4_COCIT|nr:hypothetical protein CISG_06113 [Coccidioides immitis RMSCC 3703]